MRNKKLVAGLFALYLLQGAQPTFSQALKAKKIDLTDEQCYKTIDDIAVVGFKGQDFKITKEGKEYLIEYGKSGGICNQIDDESAAKLWKDYSHNVYMVPFKDDKPVLILMGNFETFYYRDKSTIIIKKK